MITTCSCGWPRCSTHREHLPCSECWAQRLEAAIDSIGPVPGVLALALGSLLLTALGGAL